MYCENCGKELKEGIFFCTECGHKIESVEGIKMPSTEENEPESVNTENAENSNHSITIKKGNLILAIIIAVIITFFIFMATGESLPLLSCSVVGVIVACIAKSISQNLLVAIIAFIVAASVYSYPAGLVITAESELSFIFGMLINLVPVVAVITVILYEFNERKGNKE